MLQRILAVSVGGLVTLGCLFLFDWMNLDQNSGYVGAVVIGGIANLLWPWVIGLWAARRVKARRDSQMEAEVQRQISEQQGPR